MICRGLWWLWWLWWSVVVFRFCKTTPFPYHTILIILHYITAKCNPTIKKHHILPLNNYTTLHFTTPNHKTLYHAKLCHTIIPHKPTPQKQHHHTIPHHTRADIIKLSFKRKLFFIHLHKPAAFFIVVTFVI